MNSFWVLRAVLAAGYRPRSVAAEFNRWAAAVYRATGGYASSSATWLVHAPALHPLAHARAATDSSRPRPNACLGSWMTPADP